jgi:crotonobetainyl-CoA:carnitine CoA-transferase CaiB-like acyl-CoA transferase
MGGLMSITGNSGDQDGLKAGVAVADLFTGMWAAVAILAALQARAATNRGQYIDLALFDCQLAMLGNVAANWFLTEKLPRRFGNAHPNIVPYQTFQARDGAFALAVGNDRQFAALCEVMDCTELIARFATNETRVKEREACVRALEEIFHKYSRAEIIDRCASRAIPAGPINNVAEAFADEQTKAREMIINGSDHDRAAVKMIGSPIKMSDTQVAYRYAPPALGEHNDEILGELGYSAEQCAQWRADNVI